MLPEWCANNACESYVGHWRQGPRAAAAAATDEEATRDAGEEIARQEQNRTNDISRDRGPGVQMTKERRLRWARAHTPRLEELETRLLYRAACVPRAVLRVIVPEFSCRHRKSPKDDELTEETGSPAALAWWLACTLRLHTERTRRKHALVSEDAACLWSRSTLLDWRDWDDDDDDADNVCANVFYALH